MAPKNAAAAPTRTSSRQAAAEEPAKTAANTKAKMAKKPAANAKKSAAHAKKASPKAEQKAKVTKKATATKNAPAKAPAKKEAATKAAAAKKEPANKAPAKLKAGKAKAEEVDVEMDEAEPEAPKAKTAKVKATVNGTTKKVPAKNAAAATKPKSTKRKATEEPEAPEAKKVKIAKKGPVINHPPAQRLYVFVFGEGSAGELGLGTAQGAVDVKRPRLNPNLAVDKVGVVQIAAGGMHVVALTHDGKILTWGVNDNGALGRDTNWTGGLKDVEDNKSESSDDSVNDSGLNPRESMPTAVEFVSLPEGTRFTQVVAGDSTTFALTDDGKVWGCGTFRSNEGIFGFLAEDLARGEDTQRTFKLIPGLKNIVSLSAGANHVLAMDNKGAVFAWGSGQQDQLGRRVIERTKYEGLKPREFGLPKGVKNGIVSIETGSYHSFAINKQGQVYSWGLNNYGETGVLGNAGEDDAVVLKPQIIESLKDKKIVNIRGGGHHSIAVTDTGDCLIWGRVDGNQLGISKEDLAKLSDEEMIRDDRGELRILAIPQKVEAIQGSVAMATACSDHNIAVTRDGKAWSWGFSANYQTGQGVDEDVLVPTMIDNTAIRDRKITGATSGGQFSIIYAAAEDVAVPTVNGEASN